MRCPPTRFTMFREKGGRLEYSYCLCAKLKRKPMILIGSATDPLALLRCRHETILAGYLANAIRVSWAWCGDPYDPLVPFIDTAGGRLLNLCLRLS